MAPHQQNPTNHSTDDDNRKEPSNPHMDKPSTCQWRTTTHVKPWKSNQELSQIHANKHGTHYRIYPTTMVETKSHDSDITAQQEGSSTSPQTTTQTTHKPRSNNIHRRLRPQWTDRRSNVLSLTRNNQERVHRHRRNPQCICSRTNGHPNGGLTIRNKD